MCRKGPVASGTEEGAYTAARARACVSVGQKGEAGDRKEPFPFFSYGEGPKVARWRTQFQTSRFLGENVWVGWRRTMLGSIFSSSFTES